MAGRYGDFDLDPTFGHWLWREIQNRPRVYWPESTDAFLELYLDQSWDDPLRLKRSRGIVNNDREVVTYEDENDWNKESGLGMTTSAIASYEYEHGEAQNTERVQLWGHAYTSIGTRFWFELTEDSPGTAYIDRLRVPTAPSLEDDVRDWAATEGVQVLHVKSAIFEQRFSDVGYDTADPGHYDVHLRTGEADVGVLKSVLSDALDFAERSARMES